MVKQKFNTKYNEIYAMLTLKYIYSDTYLNFICDEKPDIQNHIEKIGIEVVNAASKSEFIFNAFFNEINGKNLSIKEKKQKALKMYHCKKEENLPCYIGEIILSPLKGLFTPSAFLKEIINASKYKQLKIKNYNKQYWNQLGLYIYTLMHFEEYEIKTILPELVLSSDYDFFIINVLGDLYHVQKNLEYNKYIISNNDLKTFKQKALTRSS